MAATEAGAPDADSRGIDFGPLGQPGQHFPHVLNLLLRDDFPTHLTAALAKVSVIVENYDVASFGESLCELIDIKLLDRREAVAHQDGR
ncbi:hypothetical protein D3C77_420070 [compost metagenome]